MIVGKSKHIDNYHIYYEESLEDITPSDNNNNVPNHINVEEALTYNLVPMFPYNVFNNDTKAIPTNNDSPVKKKKKSNTTTYSPKKKTTSTKKVSKKRKNPLSPPNPVHQQSSFQVISQVSS